MEGIDCIGLNNSFLTCDELLKGSEVAARHDHGTLNIHLFIDRDNCKLFTSDEVERPRRCLRGGQDSMLPESSARREIFASVLLPLLHDSSRRCLAQFELIAHLL